MRIVLLVVVLVSVAAGCAQDVAAGSPQALAAPNEQDAAPTTTSTTTVAPTTTSTTTVAPKTTTVAPKTTTVAPTTTLEAPGASVPPFASSVAPVTAADLGESWRPGCPVAVEDLRAMTVRHRVPDGGWSDGVLVVHRDHAEQLVDVFAAIYEAGFPISSMRPVSAFGADDDRSMAADNTSAFNCREIAGRPGVWSEHSYGRAVDINPLVNPWVRGAMVDPPAGAAHADRTVAVPGLIRSGDPVTQAFAAIGWGWGGNWGSTKDYQHFSSTGR